MKSSNVKLEELIRQQDRKEKSSNVMKNCADCVFLDKRKKELDSQNGIGNYFVFSCCCDKHKKEFDDYYNSVKRIRELSNLK